MKTNCAYCNKELERRPCRARGRNYCNHICQMKYEYENGLRDPKTATKKAHEKMKQLAKEGKHPFQREDVKEKSKKKKRTPEGRLNASLAKMGEKNGMYGKTGKLNPSWKRIQCKCLNCGKMFYVKKSHVEIGEGKYCSRQCCKEAKSNQIEKRCVYCGQAFIIQGCRKNTAHYCSLDCRNKYLVGEKAAAWQGGKSFEPYSPEFNNRLKIEIRKRDDNICQICGRIQINRALSIHHIDYNKQNNEPKNLISLCLVCHRKTNHNREYWQSQFEDFRHHSRYDRLTIEK